MTNKKKKLTLWSAVSFLIALVPIGGWLLPDPFGTHDDDGRKFGGQWRGTIVRPSGDRWELDITLDVDHKTGSFDLASPAMRCSGTLTVVSHSGERLRVLERLTRTVRGTCTPNAYITLSLQGTGVHVVWQDADALNVIGTGELNRG
ncbi:hypothetical protein [Actinomadura monticuli]|uniref:META domain-containing protein n=1 Tax=Actinomadura monticuli TaxID=3097367 RepID=A0ABV4Q5R9_9ACTN